MSQSLRNLLESYDNLSYGIKEVQRTWLPSPRKDSTVANYSIQLKRIQQKIEQFGKKYKAVCVEVILIEETDFDTSFYNFTDITPQDAEAYVRFILRGKTLHSVMAYYLPLGKAYKI